MAIAVTGYDPTIIYVNAAVRATGRITLDTNTNSGTGITKGIDFAFAPTVSLDIAVGAVTNAAGTDSAIGVRATANTNGSIRGYSLGSNVTLTDNSGGALNVAGFDS